MLATNLIFIHFEDLQWKPYKTISATKIHKNQLIVGFTFVNWTILNNF